MHHKAFLLYPKATANASPALCAGAGTRPAQGRPFAGRAQKTPHQRRGARNQQKLLQFAAVIQPENAEQQRERKHAGQREAEQRRGEQAAHQHGDVQQKEQRDPGGQQGAVADGAVALVGILGKIAAQGGFVAQQAARAQDQHQEPERQPGAQAAVKAAEIVDVARRQQGGHGQQAEQQRERAQRGQRRVQTHGGPQAGAVGVQVGGDAGKQSTEQHGSHLHLAEVEHFLDRKAEITGDLVGQLQAGRVLAHLDAGNGLARDADRVGQLLLAELVRLAQRGDTGFQQQITSFRPAGALQSLLCSFSIASFA